MPQLASNIPSWYWVGLLGIAAIASCASFIAYALDKRRARLGRWRIRERTLHLLDLAGGWPGGLAAQRLVRHKTRDRPFQIVFWLTVAGNSLCWIALGLTLATRTHPDSRLSDLNRRPAVYKTAALPTELRRRPIPTTSIARACPV